jgi:hypothetical protein
MFLLTAGHSAIAVWLYLERGVAASKGFMDGKDYVSSRGAARRAKRLALADHLGALRGSPDLLAGGYQFSGSLVPPNRR